MARHVYHPNGKPIDPAAIARIRADATDYADVPLGSPAQDLTAYEGGRRGGQWFANWSSAIRSPDLEWLPNRDQSVARARDLARNEPVAGAALARRKNAAVGKGWRLSSKPDPLALGITPAAAATLAAQIESQFRLYAQSHNFQVDAERRLTFAQQLRIAFHGLMADGEGCAIIEWAADEGTPYATRLRLVDPDRLSNPTGQMNDAIWRNGIEHSPYGAPIRYWFREAHPADYNWSTNAFQWTGFERFTPWGRPQVLHWLDPERAAQSRGVSRFVQSLKSFRALSKFTDATLQNAAINAMFLGTISSAAGPQAVSETFGPDDLSGYNEDRNEFYDQNPVVDATGTARFMALPPGDEVKMMTTGRQLTGFDSFIRANIRLIAASLGVTYEEISMDYSQTNYSSARAALIHATAESDAASAIVEAQLVKPFYVAWLEEAFDSGKVKIPAGAPDFLDAVDAYATARWIGPKRGYIDPVKEILAAAARIEVGVSTLEDECAEQGKDWQEVIHQQGREAQLRKAVGLDSEEVAVADAFQDTKNPAKQAPAPANPPGDPAAGAKPASALARVREIGLSASHDADLDARIAA